MADNFHQERKQKLAFKLEDGEYFYPTLQHGADVLEVCFGQFGFKSLQEALDWSAADASYNFDHVKGRALEILIITEKRTMSREVSRILSSGRYKVERGKEDKISEDHYYFAEELFDKVANVRVISTAGHLTTQTFPEQLDQNESESLLYAKIIDIPVENKERKQEFYMQYGINCDMIIVATDNDEAGEKIGFECILFLLPHVNCPPSGNRMDIFYRARFSSAPEIVNAIHDLTRPNFLTYLSMVAKGHLDLRSGVAFSRIQKVIARHYLPTKFIPKLSFRPCGSICVKLIANRYDEVNNSAKKFCLEFSVSVNDKEVVVFCDGEFSKVKAEKLCDKLKKIKQCEVVQVSKSNPISEPSPPGLNSFELLKFLSRYLRIDSSAAAQVAQHLYEIGLISYPRSESTKYSYDFVVVLEQLYHNLKIVNGTKVLGRYENRTMEVIEKMEIDTIENAKNKGVDSLDHPPITPTQKRLINYDESGQRRYSNNQYLNNTDKIVYNFIVRRFLAIFMDAYSYCKNAVKFKVGLHEFEYSFFTTQKAGFTELLPELIKNGTNDKNLSFNIGSKFPFDVRVKEIPMPFLEEYELIQNMEDYNIGTDGSIPNHIAVIERVKYVKIDNDTFTLEPELLGTLLVNAYKDCIPDLINPKCRARFIKDIRCIASGEKSFIEVYEKYLKEFDENFQRLSKALFLYFNEHVDKFRDCFPNNKCVTGKRR